jgi:hypothetical protein
LAVGAGQLEDSRGDEPADQRPAALDAHAVPAPPGDRLEHGLRQRERGGRGGRRDGGNAGAEDVPHDVQGELPVAVAERALLRPGQAKGGPCGRGGPRRGPRRGSGWRCGSLDPPGDAAPAQVLSVRDRLEVVGVDAEPVPAGVVEHEPVRDRADDALLGVAVRLDNPARDTSNVP